MKRTIYLLLLCLLGSIPLQAQVALGGLYTPIYLKPDRTEIILRDYLADLKVLEIHLPQGLSNESKDDDKLLLVGNPLRKISTLKIETSEGEKALVLIKSAAKEVVFTYDRKDIGKDREVHLIGTFNNWNRESEPMTQVGTTMIYSVTVNIPDGNYQYKFINDNGWGGVESVPAASQVDLGNGNDNRWVHVAGDDTLAAVMFGGAAPMGHSAVSMVLDMSLEATIDTVVSVAGDFQGWSPGTTQLTDLNSDSVYRYIAYVPTTDTMPVN